MQLEVFYSYDKSGSALNTSSNDSGQLAAGCDYATLFFGSWSGTKTGATSPYDTSTFNVTSSSGTGLIDGTITTAVNGELIISALGNAGGFNNNTIVSGGYTVNGSTQSGGNNGSEAYLIQTSAGVSNVQWQTESSANGLEMIAFEPAAGGASAPINFLTIHGGKVTIQGGQLKVQ